jgi:CHASE2 domain-containing sensor protein
LWTVGYLAAPVLFASLPDRSLAGSIAGMLFRAQAWLSLACGLLLLLMLWLDKSWSSKRTSVILVIAMLACVSIGYFALQPFMAEIRAAAANNGGIMDEAMRARFGMLHGVASVIYLLQSVLALVLVTKTR